MGFKLSPQGTWMITWMQRKRKYLVVTIWVSVIAFVGAGFVGWGAYNFNADRASSVAKVGERTITVQEYQMAYANYFNFYNNMLGGGLTQEKADQMGLEAIVLENVINETLILAYADEIGLRANKYEIKEALSANPAFHKNGVFDKDTYYRVLRQSQLKAKDYETSLERQILLSKTQDILNLKPTQIEQELFVSSMFMKNRLSVDVIYLDEDEVKVSEDEIKQHWEKFKADYLTEKSFDLATIKIDLTDESINEEKLKTFYQEKRHNYKSSDGKIMSFEDARVDVEKDFRFKLTKREALESYLLFKKSKIDATGEKNVKISDTTFPIDKLSNARVGDVLKPIQTDDGYIVIQLIRINNPTPKPYIEARSAILAQLKAQKKAEVLEQKAKSRLELFRGKDVGFVSREGGIEIDGLNSDEVLEFVNFVFDNNEVRNFAIIGNKAVLYQILEQDLLDEDEFKRHVKLINENIKQMKQAEISQNLIVNLKKRYNIEQYYKGQ